MTLREKIKQAIQFANEDAGQAAGAVCRLLEHEIGLNDEDRGRLFSEEVTPGAPNRSLMSSPHTETSLEALWEFVRCIGVDPAEVVEAHAAHDAFAFGVIVGTFKAQAGLWPTSSRGGRPLGELSQSERSWDR